MAAGRSTTSRMRILGRPGRPGSNQPRLASSGRRVRLVTRSTLPQWGSIRYPPPIRTYDAPPMGVHRTCRRADEISGNPHPNNITLFSAARHLQERGRLHVLPRRPPRPVGVEGYPHPPIPFSSLHPSAPLCTLSLSLLQPHYPLNCLWLAPGVSVASQIWSGVPCRPTPPPLATTPKNAAHVRLIFHSPHPRA